MTDPKKPNSKAIKRAITNQFLEVHDAIIREGKESSASFLNSIGIVPQNLSGYRNGTRYFQLDIYGEKLKNLFSVNPDFLRGISKEMFITNQNDHLNQNSPSLQNFEQLNNENTVWLPYLPVKARAGLGKYVNTQTRLFEMNESYAIYRGKLPRNYEDCFIVEVDGDSMEPTLLSKDKVLCKPLNDVKTAVGIAVVYTSSEEFMIKRVVLCAENHLVLTSDNPAGERIINVRYEDIISISKVLKLVERDL